MFWNELFLFNFRRCRVVVVVVADVDVDVVATVIFCKILKFLISVNLISEVFKYGFGRHKSLLNQ